MLSKLNAILECSRIFSLPMTIMSWLVAFVFALLNAGNTLYGILAFFGVCFAHLATNIFDDYFDYKALIKQVGFNKKEYLKNSQRTKCRYIISGRMKTKEVLALALLYATAAVCIGLFLYFKCGIGVIYFALIGGIIGISYSFLSKIRLSELAVALAYGPALFGGVYYVMTKTFSKEVLILSVPTMFITVVLLYIHTIMDYEYDINAYRAMLKFGGEMAIVGLPSHADSPKLDSQSLIWQFQNKKLYSSLIGGIKETQEMLDFSVKHSIYPKVEMIQISELDSAYKKVAAGKADFRFVIDMKSLV